MKKQLKDKDEEEKEEQNKLRRYYSISSLHSEMTDEEFDSSPSPKKAIN